MFLGGKISTRKRKVRTAAAKKPKPPKKAISVEMGPGLWLKNAKQIAAFRELLVSEQGGLDPILGEPLRKPCLDHDHFSGETRGVLSQSVNTFEGYVLKAWMKYVSGYTDTSLSEALRNMADYLEKDYYRNPLHGGYKDDMVKFLWRCTVDTIIRRGFEDLDITIPEGLSKPETIEIYIREFVKQAEGGR